MHLYTREILDPLNDLVETGTISREVALTFAEEKKLITAEGG